MPMNLENTPKISAQTGEEQRGAREILSTTSSVPVLS